MVNALLLGGKGGPAKAGHYVCWHSPAEDRRYVQAHDEEHAESRPHLNALHARQYTGLGTRDPNVEAGLQTRLDQVGTNARNRRGLSMVIVRSISSVTPALRSFGAKTVSVIAYPGRASLRAVKL